MPSAPPSDPSASLDGVRQKLRERGYLDGRIERFVLRDFVAPGETRARPSRAAVKASVLGAPILGALLTAAAAAANWPLLGRSDVALLAGYFTVLAGLVLLALNLIVAALVSAVAERRGPRSAQVSAAGFLVGLPTLAYVALLWSSRDRIPGAAADLFFIAGALLATPLVAWLAGLVSVARIAGRTREVPDRARLATFRFVCVALPLAAAVLILGVGRGDTRAAAGPSFEIAERDGRLLVVGVDGLDPTLLDAFGSTRGAAGFRRAAERGAAFELRRRQGAEPPEIWTTLFTGTPRETHGVESAAALRLPGVSAPLRGRSGPLPLQAALHLLWPARSVPTPSSSREVRTVWEITALRLPVAAVGWWATWPAVADPQAEGASFLVTDRVLPKLLADQPGDRDTLPASLYDRLRADFGAERERLAARFDAEFGPAVAPAAREWLWESFLIDAYGWSVTRWLADGTQARAAFVYLPGLDILRHRLGSRAGEGIGAVVETEQAVGAYLAWLERTLIGAEDAWAGWSRVIVGDPGRSCRAGDAGLVLVLGPAAVAGCHGPDLNELDLTPLLLDLLGFPRSQEMDGRPPDRCLSVGQDAGSLATYGTRPPGVGRDAAGEFDEEMLERLRALGYVK